MRQTRATVGLSMIIAMVVIVTTSQWGGCYSVPDGYTLVRNRLRIAEQTLPFVPGTTRLRLAVADGIWESELTIWSITVRKGHVTFHGCDGSISVMTNGHMTVRRRNTEGVFPPRDASTWIDLDLNGSRAMLFQWSIDAVVCEQFQGDIMGLSPQLICSQSNRLLLIDVPISYSDDFEGSIGGLTLSPNWYNGPRWSRLLRR